MMTYPQVAAAVLAVVVVLFPQIKAAAARVVERFKASGPVLLSQTTVHPTYSDVMADLQSVRLRLIRTGCLSDDQRSAIDVLTLALVDGSDK